LSTRARSTFIDPNGQSVFVLQLTLSISTSKPSRGTTVVSTLRIERVFAAPADATFDAGIGVAARATRTDFDAATACPSGQKAKSLAPHARDDVARRF
jgi:hypothetical protein